MTTKCIISPGKYIQGPHELKNIAQITVNYGKKAFLLSDDFVWGLTKNSIEQSFSDLSFPYHFAPFNGECSREEIDRLKLIVNENSCDCVIGVGGGKTLDCAKAIAYELGLPVLIVPTIASTDAPTSALSVLYRPDGSFDQYLPLPTNPSVVLMDTTIIAAAPIRLLVAGMGDALATYFEARAVQLSHSTTMAGSEPTRTAFALAKLCYQTLLEDGLKAKIAAEAKMPNTALENIIEANTYLSGIGFESGGLAAAHAIHNGLTQLEETHGYYHGEKVAFGTLTQLVLENAPLDEIKRVIHFCKSVGLPTTLKDLGVSEITEEKLMKVATAAATPTETIHNMPFKVSAEDVYSALLSADKLGSIL